MNESARGLLARCGAAMALAGVLWTSAPVMAQEKPADDPQAAAREEFMRKIKEEAAKMGIKTDQPQPGPAPANQTATQPPAPAPAPAPAPVNPQPAKPQPTVTTPPPTPAGAKPTTPAGKGPATSGQTNPMQTKPGQPGAKPPAPGAIQPRPGVVPGPGAQAPAGASVESLNQTRSDPDFGSHGENFQFVFVEPTELTLVVASVMEDLEQQYLFMDGGLIGQKIYFNAPLTVKRSEVLKFVTMLLEQREYMMVQDASGIFTIQPKNQQGPAFGGQWASTRIIHTPNMKPSSLQTSVQALLAAGRGGQGGTQPVFMDDLGLIVMTDSPRITGLIEEFVNRLAEERAALKFYRFSLVNVSAAAARERVLELLGQQAQRISSGAAGQGGGAVAAPPVAGGGGQTITNLAERMTIDPTSNSLFLRGREDEQRLLSDMLVVIDVPNGMISKWYPVGYKTSQAVASTGRAEQLGGISEQDLSDGTTSRGGGLGVGTGRAGGAGGTGSDSGVGAGFTLYPDAGGFIYRGTEPQHARVRALVENLAPLSADEKPTIEFYKLHHGKSTDVADTIQNLLSNSAGSGNRGGGLLGRDLGSRSRTTPRPAAGANQAAAQPNTPAGATGGLGDLEGADVFVLADEPNNQIVVKAPAKLQPQFRQLISKIDLRRPQVYIDAKIVVVSSTDSSRLAIEAQQIIGQFAFNTNFGLGTLGTAATGTTAASGSLFDPKNVLPNLSGWTSALVRSKDVPFIINAIANEIDTRIVATPQLLVDDNEEAEVSSLDQQPTSTSQSQSVGGAITTFGGYESAGPKFKVKPQISEGGYLRLEYSVELSSFSGSGASGQPPPKLENKIESKAVTVPTDSTIIVGGLTFTQTGHTVIKIPLLGDIPLVGNLFKDQSQSNRISSLYVFITPKIMRDPTFSDLRLLSKAPLVESGMAAEYPAPTPEAIPVIDTARQEQERKLQEEADKHRAPEPTSPAKGTPVRRDKPKSDEPD